MEDLDLLAALEMNDDEEAVAPPSPILPPGLPEDERYLSWLSRALAVCANYKPKLGQNTKEGLSLSEFHSLYGADLFMSG